MERISGPVLGYFLVSYACAVGELGEEYMGYTRLCLDRPGNFWDAAGRVFYGDARFRSEELAIANSEAIALAQLASDAPRSAADARPWAA